MALNMPEIILTNITKRWNKFYAVDNLNLVIDDNAFITLLGPSGCGKTTILRMIAGLETPTSGKITIGGITVFDSDAGINIPPNKRRVGFLFQNYALWPNMTVYQNIAFGLTNIKEEMPNVDSNAARIAGLLRSLKKPDEIVRLIEDSRDKAGKIDLERAYVKLIDQFEISMVSAKRIIDFRLHEASDPQAAASIHISKLSNELDAINKKYSDSGIILNERYECVRDGITQTSVRKLSTEEVDHSVRRVARIVKIGMFMNRYPNELSGGQQQRVAIARTLAPGPTVLFMDEPLSNLDAKLRLEMRSELQRLHINTGSTFIYVTHDQMEAMTLATKICLLDNGVLQQYEAPLDVYNKPANLFTADFVGSPAINFIEASGSQAHDGTFTMKILDGAEVTFIPNEAVDLVQWHQNTETQIASNPQTPDKANKDTAFRYGIAMADDIDNIETKAKAEAGEEHFVIGVRPEFIKLGGDAVINGEIYSAMPTGMETTVRLRIGDFLLTGVVFGGVLYKIGECIRIGFEPGGIILFNRDNGRRIACGSLQVR